MDTVYALKDEVLELKQVRKPLILSAETLGCVVENILSPGWIKRER